MSSAPTSQPSNRRRHLSDRAILNLFIWPTLILLIAMNIFPLFYSLYLSFTNYSAIARQIPIWIGFDNFIPCFICLMIKILNKSYYKI